MIDIWVGKLSWRAAVRWGGIEVVGRAACATVSATGFSSAQSTWTPIQRRRDADCGAVSGPQPEQGGTMSSRGNDGDARPRRGTLEIARELAAIFAKRADESTDEDRFVADNFAR